MTSMQNSCDLLTVHNIRQNGGIEKKCEKYVSVSPIYITKLNFFINSFPGTDLFL